MRRLRKADQPVIAVDAGELGRLAPDLIITQGLCEVCAVADGETHRVARGLATPSRVLSLEARSLEEIWADIREVGGALGLDDEADELVLGLQSRLARMRLGRTGSGVRVLCIEWLEPLYLSRPGPRAVDDAACIQVALLGREARNVERWLPPR